MIKLKIFKNLNLIILNQKILNKFKSYLKKFLGKIKVLKVLNKNKINKKLFYKMLIILDFNNKIFWHKCNNLKVLEMYNFHKKLKKIKVQKHQLINLVSKKLNKVINQIKI